MICTITIYHIAVILAVACAIWYGGIAKKDFLFIMAAGVAFIMIGVYMLGFGIQIPAGYEETHALAINATHETGTIAKTAVCSALNGLISRGFALIILLTGLYMTIRAGDMRRNQEDN